MNYTSDQIRTMPAGVELDELAARIVMGWSPDMKNVQRGYWLNGHYNLYRRPDYVDRPRDWSPSTNIAHAWELVEKIRQEYREKVRTNAEYVASAFLSLCIQLTYDPSIDPWTLPASGAALVITRAANLAKMGER